MNGRIRLGQMLDLGLETVSTEEDELFAGMPFPVGGQVGSPFESLNHPQVDPCRSPFALAVEERAVEQ